jgi:hypothetical protein
MGDVVDFGKLKLSRKEHKTCMHDHLEYDIPNEAVTCKDCKEPIGAFKAFTLLIEHHQHAWERIEHARNELSELERKSNKPLLKALDNLNKAWRSRGMVPCCPHCHEAIFPEDGLGGSMLNKEIALARRKNRAEKK